LRPDQANNSQDLISKITRAKWTGGVAQAIESLLCMHKALSSNPSITKKESESDQAWWLTPIIPATQEAKIKRILIQFKTSLGKKVSETPPISMNKLGMVVHVYNPSYSGDNR
jgi:hypothetical protein